MLQTEPKRRKQETIGRDKESDQGEKEMFEQLSIFDFLEPNREKEFSWDKDINEIRNKLCDLASRYGLEIAREDWSIWEHAKEYGYRMSFIVKVTKENVKDNKLFEEIETIVDFAKTKNIELAPMCNAIFFFSGENTAKLTFFTDFMDKQRRKRKEW